MSRSHKGKAIHGSTQWCALCGLRIPDAVIPNHPLFGTVDHFIPRSKSGKDNKRNRVAAHKFCNEKKASKWPVSCFQVESWRTQVAIYLRALGMTITIQDIKKARNRSRLSPAYPQSYYNFKAIREGAVEVQRWEDDGGTVSEVALSPLIRELRGQ